MIRFYKWGDSVPDWIVKSSGRKIPLITFNGLVLVYKYRGEIIVQSLFGRNIVKITGSDDCIVTFNNTVMKTNFSPLNILRKIIRIF